MAYFRLVSLVMMVVVLVGCGGTTPPVETSATASANAPAPTTSEVTSAPAAPATSEATSETTGATQLSPEEALTASAAEASAVAATPGVVQLSPEEALTASAAEANAVASTADAALPTAAPTNGPTSAPTTAPGGPLQDVTLGLGYIPNVQFAPFYVASSKGYYAAEGLNVDFSYGGNVNDLLLQTATGQLPFVMASGDEVLLARSQGIPVKMTGLVFQQVPVSVFSKADAGIAAPADLRGKTIGLPGRYGATYIALRGLLYAQGLQETDVTLSEIGFTQFEAVQSDRVPAAVGYANNEPLRLADSGAQVNVIEVADYINLVSNGIVTSESYLQQNPDTVRRFLRATLRGLEDTFANPEEAFNLSLQFIPELAVDQQPFQRRVLDATIPYWKPADGDASRAMTLDPQAWQTTYTFLRESGILTGETDPAQAFTTEFLP